MVPDRGHGGHWRVVVAVVGLTIALTCGWALLAPRAPDIPRSEYLRGKQSGYQAGGPECEPNRLERLVGPNAESERHACAKDAEEYRLTTEDLVQQTRSANAANLIVDLTYGQSLIAHWGLLAGVLTMVAAVAAAYFAWRAAKATEQSVEEAKAATRAADQSVAETKATAQRQLRAYVFVERILLTEHGIDNSTYISIKIRNTGQTPAYKFRIWTQIEYNPDRMATFDPYTLPDRQGKFARMDIGGGIMRSSPYARNAQDFGNKQELLLNDTYAHAFGRISYIDCFEKERKGRFHFLGRVRAGGIVEESEMEHADQGNEYD